MSDNASEGSYQNDHQSKKAKQDKLRHTKQGFPDTLGSNWKFDMGRKTQTFHSDMEENYSGVSMPPALPPIKKQNKKGGAPNVQLPLVGGQQIM